MIFQSFRIAAAARKLLATSAVSTRYSEMRTARRALGKLRFQDA